MRVYLLLLLLLLAISPTMDFSSAQAAGVRWDDNGSP